jgi:hypothetical protein
LFISHSSDDHDVAVALIGLIRSALNLPADVIRCTSVDGYRLPGGADTNAQLKQEVHDAEAFLFELGARWGAGRHLLPLLTPGTPTSTLSGPLAGLNALACDSRGQLQQLVIDLGGLLGITPGRADAFQADVDRLVSMGPRIAEVVGRSRGGGSVGHAWTMDDRDIVNDLSREARELLTQAGRDRLGVMMIESLQGLSVAANGREFTEPGNRRSEAKWKAAAQQLMAAGLLESEGDGSLLPVTDLGYRIADLLGERE